MMRTMQKNAKFERYVFLILLAVEMIMSFTFLGYIHIPPLSITTAYIPIVVAACLFGPGEAAVAGLCFGLGSMFKASALYVMPDDKLFSPFQSGYPLQSLLLSVCTRVLFGFLIGCLFCLAKRGRLSWLWKSILALIASRLHAFLVYGAMGILFPETGVSFRKAFQLNKNAIFLSLFCLACVTLCDFIYRSRYLTEYRNALNAADGQHKWSRKIGIFLSVITVFVCSMAVFSTIYFSDRTKYMLDVYGVDVSDAIQHDVLHLQIQFLFSMLALCLILILVILMVYRYMKHREYVGEMDALTGVMGRRLFLNYCTECQTKTERANTAGWFLFLDVDRFKQINDTLGHSAGDETLKQVAAVLRRSFTASAGMNLRRSSNRTFPEPRWSRS